MEVSIFYFRLRKSFLEQTSPEPKVKALIPMYEPLEVIKCKKCGKLLAEPKELIGIVKNDIET